MLNPLSRTDSFERSNPWTALARHQPADKQELCDVVTRLEHKGFHFDGRLTNGDIRDYIVDDKSRTWRFDAELPGEKGFVTVMSLDELRVLDGVSGIGAPALTPAEQDQLAAIQGLWGKGYGQHAQGDRVHAASLINSLAKGYPIYLHPQEGSIEYNTCKSGDELQALAYFEGITDKAPERGAPIKAAADRGFTLHNEGGYKVSSHTAWREGLGRVSLGKAHVRVDADQLGDLDALEAHVKRVDAAWDRYCAPLFERHHLGFGTDYHAPVTRMGGRVDVEVRMAVLAGLVEAYKQAIPAQGIFTHEVLPIFQALEERASGNAQMVRMAGRLLPRIGKMSREELLEAARTSPSLAALPASDPASSARLTTLLERTGDLRSLTACLDAMRSGKPEDVEDRMDAMLALLDVLPERERDLAAEHYRTMSDLDGPSMREKFDAYLKDLYAQRIVERRQEPAAFSVPEPKEAKEPGTVTRDDGFVTIAGVKVPRKS